MTLWDYLDKHVALAAPFWFVLLMLTAVIVDTLQDVRKWLQANTRNNIRIDT